MNKRVISRHIPTIFLKREFEGYFCNISNNYRSSFKGELCRRVIRNQHKLRRFFQRQIHLCSSNSLRTQEVLRFEEDECITSVPEPVKHEPDVGQQFAASDLCVRLAAPDQLQPKPDVNKLSFGSVFTDHMLKICYHKSLGGWQKPEITPFENLVIHPAAKVLHYAVELFEGMKAYRGVDGCIRIFRPEMNMHRMNLTARRSGLPTFEGKEFIKCLSRLISVDQEWVPQAEAASLYMRPTLIGIDPILGVAASESALLYTILSPVGKYFKAGSSGAISLLADPRYTRAWPGGVGDRKMGSNYAPTIHVQKEAAKQGLQQVLWLYGEDHQLTEAGTMNIFMFYINDNGEKELITPPLDGLILPGVTRDSILRLSRQWGEFNVTECRFTMPMICDLLKEEKLLELFGSGTAAVVSPVDRINYMGTDLHIPTMKQEKPVFEKIKTTMSDIQYGKLKHPWGVVID